MMRYLTHLDQTNHNDTSIREISHHMVRKVKYVLKLFCHEAVQLALTECGEDSPCYTPR